MFPTVCDRDVFKILAVDITFGKRQGKSTLLRVNLMYVMQRTCNIKKTNICYCNKDQESEDES